jgi:hypothetical protein
MGRGRGSSGEIHPGYFRERNEDAFHQKLRLDVIIDRRADAGIYEEDRRYGRYLERRRCADSEGRQPRSLQRLRCVQDGGRASAVEGCRGGEAEVPGCCCFAKYEYGDCPTARYV